MEAIDKPEKPLLVMGICHTCHKPVCDGCLGKHEAHRIQVASTEDWKQLQARWPANKKLPAILISQHYSM